MASSRTQRPDPADAAFRPSIVRIVVVVLGAAALGWLAFAVSVAGFARTSNPELAAQLAPFDAIANGERAYGLIEEGDSATTQAAAKALATAALVRDPTAVGAVRTLGLVADAENRPDQAIKLFAYSEALSRRDFATQLWLIDSRVNADDTVGALNHFDKALRTSKLAASVLIPILVRALDDERLVEPIAKLLSNKPPWRSAYMYQLTMTTKSLPNIANLAVRVGAKDEAVSFGRLFAENHRYDLAALMFARFGRKPDSMVHGFDKVGAFLPFDWELLNAERVSTILGSDAADKNFVSFTVNGGFTAEIAKKLVALQPGAYAIVGAAKLDDPTSGRLAMSITCAQPAVRLVQLSIEGRIAGRLKVPATGCAYQWVNIALVGNRGALSVTGNISAFDIMPETATTSATTRIQRNTK